MEINFSIINKKQKESKSYYEKDKFGVIKFFNNEYKVYVDSKLYSINKENFNCKNKKALYSEKLDKNNRKIIYYINENFNTNIIGFKPFIPGCIVRGDIIKIKNNYIFNIKKIYINNYGITDVTLLNLSKTFTNEYSRKEN